MKKVFHFNANENNDKEKHIKFDLCYATIKFKEYLLQRRIRKPIDHLLSVC